MKIDLDSPPAYEWTVTRANKTQHFGVLIRAWTYGHHWTWNVYALIYPEHPTYAATEDELYDIPLHCGPTYDRQHTEQSHFGTHTYRKIGSDYAHCDDDQFMRSDPIDGIPWRVKYDAELLANELWARQEQGPKA